jgi:hypothetical protein
MNTDLVFPYHAQILWPQLAVAKQCGMNVDKLTLARLRTFTSINNTFSP